MTSGGFYVGATPLFVPTSIPTAQASRRGAGGGGLVRDWERL